MSPQGKRDDQSEKEALLKAVGYSNVAKIKAMIQAGTDINQTIGPMGTALHYAVDRRGNVLSALLAAGAQLDAVGNYGGEGSGWTPLMIAIRVGNTDHCQQLIEAGADPNKRDNSGQTTLMIAISWDRVQIIRMLLEAGADVHATDSHGHNALAHTKNSAVAQMLRDAGARDAKLAEQNLAQACTDGDLSAVSALLQAGVDPNTRTIWGGTSLLIAAEKGHGEIVSLLLKSGADPNFGARDNLTPLMNAVYGGHLEIVKTLLQAGANAGMTRVSGYTTLLYAQNAKRGPSYKPILALIRGALQDRPQNMGLSTKRGVEFSDMSAAVLLVKAGLDDTLAAIVRLSPSATILRGVFERRVRAGNHSFVVYQFKGHHWTTMMEVSGLKPLDEQARTLEELKTKTLTYEYSDAACAYRYRLFNGQTMIESLESDDNGVRFTSAQRPAIKQPPNDLQTFINEFFTAQDAFVPGIGVVRGCERGRTFEVNLPGYNRGDFVRVDFVSL